MFPSVRCKNAGERGVNLQWMYGKNLADEFRFAELSKMLGAQFVAGVAVEMGRQFFSAAAGVDHLAPRQPSVLDGPLILGRSDFKGGQVLG